MNKTPTLFSRIGQSKIALSVRKSASLMISKLAPNWVYEQVEHSFLKPESKKIDKNNVPHGIRLFKIKTPQGTLQAYKLGQGPAVLLVHGWSGGAHQFFPLMNGLSRCGYMAISFDHFGHGHSDGESASLPSFVSAVSSVLKYINHSTSEGLAAIVGHSMGCIAIANAQKSYLEGTPLLLISPVFNFKKYFPKQVNLQGLHPKISKQFLAKFEKSYLSDLDRMELKLKLADYSADTVIVHDKQDKVSGVLDSIKFCSTYPLTKLVVTKDFGHNRLINSEVVWQQLKSHLNYEDITAQPFK